MMDPLCAQWPPNTSNFQTLLRIRLNHQAMESRLKKSLLSLPKWTSREILQESQNPSIVAEQSPCQLQRKDSSSWPRWNWRAKRRVKRAMLIEAVVIRALSPLRNPVASNPLRNPSKLDISRMAAQKQWQHWKSKVQTQIEGGSSWAQMSNDELSLLPWTSDQ